MELGLVTPCPLLGTFFLSLLRFHTWQKAKLLLLEGNIPFGKPTLLCSVNNGLCMVSNANQFWGEEQRNKETSNSFNPITCRNAKNSWFVLRDSPSLDFLLYLITRISQNYWMLIGWDGGIFFVYHIRGKRTECWLAETEGIFFLITRVLLVIKRSWLVNRYLSRASEVTRESFSRWNYFFFHI